MTWQRYVLSGRVPKFYEDFLVQRDISVESFMETQSVIIEISLTEVLLDLGKGMHSPNDF